MTTLEKLLPMALLLAACPGPAPSLDPKLSVIQKNIFSINCTQSSCHSAAGHAGNLDLADGHAFAQLVGHVADNAAAQADGLSRVKASDTSKSFLLLKLHATIDAKYGANMPFNSTPLSDGDRGVIEQWITSGALND